MTTEQTMLAAPPRVRGRSDVRYHYLDALRSGLMFFGVFVHGALGDDSVFRGIARVSGLFRMGGFFLISGFFSAMLVLRYGPRLMVRRRLASIGVPLLAVGLLCNPVALWLIYNNYNSKIGFVDFITGDGRAAHPQGPLTWHLQLWFLVSLLVYALASPAVFALWRRAFDTKLLAWARTARSRTMTLLVGVLLVLTVICEAVYLVWSPVAGHSQADYVVRETLAYFPFFAVGMGLFLDDQVLLEHFRRPAPLLLVVGMVLVAAAELKPVPLLDTAMGVALARAVLALAITTNLFAVASRIFRRESRVLRYTADAAFSVYLFHYVTIYALAALFGVDVDAAWPSLLVIVLLTIGVTLVVHHLLIRRFKILSKIFNGKFTIGQRPAAAQPAMGPVPAGQEAALGAPDPEPWPRPRQQARGRHRAQRLARTFW